MDNLHTQELLDKLSELIKDNDYDDDAKGEYNDEGIKYIKVEDGDWVEEGKYSYRVDTFFFTDLNVYIELQQSRSGSYYSDYYYNDPEFSFVEPHTETRVITVYRTVKVTA